MQRGFFWNMQGPAFLLGLLLGTPKSEVFLNFGAVLFFNKPGAQVK